MICNFLILMFLVINFTVILLMAGLLIVKLFMRWMGRDILEFDHEHDGYGD